MSATNKQSKKEGHAAKGKKRVAWKGYVNYNVSSADKMQLQISQKEGWVYEDEISALLTQGYKLSVKYDDYHNCFAASLYAGDSTLPSSGWALSMRASTWGDAIERTVFVHCIVLQGEWGTAEDTGWSDESW